MKHRRLVRALLCSLLCTLPLCGRAQYRSPSYPRPDESETVTQLRACVDSLCMASLGGRGAGTEGERAAAAFVGRCLQEAGIDLISAPEGDTFGLRQEQGDTLVSRNVVGFIPGYDPQLRNHYIVIGARLDNLGTRMLTVDGRSVERIYPGANGNASGLALLLALARKLQAERVLLRRSVLVVAFGASLRDQAGAWYFLNRSFADSGNIDAMVNLDMVGTPSAGFYAYTASNADLNARLSALASSLQPVRPETVALEPCPSDHRAFYDRKIPSVFFTTGRYPEYNTPRDTPSILEWEGMERELEYLRNVCVDLAQGPAPSFLPAEKPRDGKDAPVPYYECDVKPAFLGSSDPAVFLRKWVYVYLKYPPAAVTQGIQGKVEVSFEIGADGKVRDVRVLHGVHPLLDEEALRVISASPDWRPGRLRGKKVRCAVSLPVEFRLEKKKK
ncbi:MAG: TonB family protein [Bacteroidales bacterium]|nr:TonB family protein [Bacteroidales bacterium]